MNRIKLVPQKQLTAIREVPTFIKGSAKGERPTGTTPRAQTHFEARAKQLMKHAGKVREQRFDPTDLHCAMKGTGKGTNTTGAYTWLNADGVSNALEKIGDIIGGLFGSTAAKFEAKGNSANGRGTSIQASGGHSEVTTTRT